ncbi:reverse transcriptase domain-containing protein [Trichonephila inaurata madagascariensis]|uniref:Reverse transcriptase domain-containing protein n=1 Tax=Trichonephila inaurata madagascariensis TaxID=2747483 RepID=A0A8X6XDM4_9ARAC|nr:reverse transcriptase domain-containing protein [Trichonephila inaurata madagascariensis]
MGALVSARLAEYLSNSFPWITSDNIFFWSDSQIILHWIQGDPLRWKEFVRNRVREIQEKSDPNHWNYCRGKTNPADKLTRGLSIYALVKDEVWWRGPDWLSSSNLQCDTSHNEINAVELTDELRKNYVPENNSVLTVNENNCNDFLNILYGVTNDYSKFIRIISYISRFVHNCRVPQSKRTGPIFADERNLA